MSATSTGRKTAAAPQFATLDAVVAAAPSREIAEAQVRVGRFFRAETGEALADDAVTFVFREPDLARLFAVSADAARLRRRNPEWSAELCQVVAMLALAHVAPAAGQKPAGVLYAEMAERNQDLFMALAAGFLEAFPHMRDWKSAEEEAKNA